MKKACNIIVKTLVSLFIVVSLYAYLCVVFMPKSTKDAGSYHYYRTASIGFEEKNTLDIIMYGNSDLSAAFIPLQLYKESGITSFLNVGSQQSVKCIEFEIKKNLKKQKPKMIFIETDCFFFENTLNTRAFRYGNPIFAPFTFHTRWKKLKPKDFYPSFNYKSSDKKGHVFDTNNGNYEWVDYMGDSTKCEPVQKSVLKDLKDIKKICDKNDIELFFFKAPSPDSWTMKKHNAVNKLINEMGEGVHFIDFNLDLEGFDFDYANGFRDYGDHLNFHGATILTSYFSSYIANNYDFVNHQNDKNYKSWDNLIKKYDEIYDV